MGDRGGLAGMVDRALDLGTSSRREFVVDDLSGRRSPVPVALIPAGQSFTSAWVAIGSEISVDGFTRISLWFSVDDWNDSVLNDIRCVGRHTSGGSDYPMPIYNPVVAATPYNILVEAEYVRLNNPAAAVPYSAVLTWDISNTMPFVVFQIKCEIDVVSCAHLASAYVTYGWGS
jgi:hypothetical protein